ncbi:MAG: DUF190 domain-containing protein [Aquificae bacterium]|nr:DUF190 domain-containing protein [Aquificota bacterium]
MSVLVRIFLKEGDRVEGIPAYRFVVEFLNREGVRGATVLKGILGYGTTGEYHFEGIETLSYDLPVVVEFVEEEGKAMEVVEKLGKFLKGGLVSLERAEIWE